MKNLGCAGGILDANALVTSRFFDSPLVAVGPLDSVADKFTLDILGSSLWCKVNKDLVALHLGRQVPVNAATAIRLASGISVGSCNQRLAGSGGWRLNLTNTVWMGGI